jgi:hypothetical protein
MSTNDNYHRIPYVAAGATPESAATAQFRSRFPETPVVELESRPAPTRPTSLMDRPLPSMEPESPVWQAIAAFNAGVADFLAPEALAAATRRAESQFGPVHPRLTGGFDSGSMPPTHC